MPPEYIIHDASKSYPGSGSYYGVYAGGAVRWLSGAERDQLARTTDPPVVSVSLSQENSNRYRDYDRAMRGYVEKRG